jgi:hypothetical protein
LIISAALFVAAALAQYNAYADSGPIKAELNAAGEFSTEWLLPNHDYAGQRFVDLKEITRHNSADLRPVCIYQAGGLWPFQTKQLVYQAVMWLHETSSRIEQMPPPVRRDGVTSGGQRSARPWPIPTAAGLPL